MKISYFARTREQIGRDEDIIELPDHIITIADVIVYLREQNDIYKQALNDSKFLRFALDNEMAVIETSIKDGTELAIFPPVTGG